MVKFRAFMIFGLVKHMDWGYTQTRNYAAVDNILKITKKKKQKKTKTHTSHHLQFANNWPTSTVLRNALASR